jgi:hypothetical protein
MKRTLSTIVLTIALANGVIAQGPPPGAPAQGGRGGGPPAARGPRSGKEAAPIDFVGTWVSPVMEDYRWRMVTPLKGDAASIPYKQDARKTIDAWDAAKDEAAGLQCKAYGAPALMRIPGRVRISWQDENTLKIESDQGRQTRLLHFGPGDPRSAAATAVKGSWQGYSVARWEAAQAPTAAGLALGTSARWSTRSQSLEVNTTNLRDGYLRKNGVPYSDRTKLTEYFDRWTNPEGQDWFTVTTIVEDPVYLERPFVTTTDFRRESDDSKFSPTPCAAR